jgi:hypothetical protein
VQLHLLHMPKSGPGESNIFLAKFVRCFCGHESMARGGNGVPKFSPGPAIPYPSTSCGRPVAGDTNDMSNFYKCPKL